MGNRLSRIVTRTGDDGTTGLGDGRRVAKSDVRITAIGEVDELNSVIGMLLAHENLPPSLRETLTGVQHDLFDLGGELSLPGAALMTPAHLARIEACVEEMNAALPPLKEFMLPGGGAAAAVCHLARTVCRRAERAVVALHPHPDSGNAAARQYLNRLSDLLFVMARVLARAAAGEVTWNRDRRQG